MCVYMHSESYSEIGIDEKEGTVLGHYIFMRMNISSRKEALRMVDGSCTCAWHVPSSIQSVYVYHVSHMHPSKSTVVNRINETIVHTMSFIFKMIVLRTHACMALYMPASVCSQIQWARIDDMHTRIFCRWFLIERCNCEVCTAIAQKAKKW